MRVEAGVDNQSLNAEICWLNVEGEVSLAKVWTSGWDILKKNEESLVDSDGFQVCSERRKEANSPSSSAFLCERLSVTAKFLPCSTPFCHCLRVQASPGVGGK